MNEEEKNKQEKLIIEQYGQPSYDAVGLPSNESAKKLRTLRLEFGKANARIKKAKRLIQQTKELSKEARTPVLPVIEDVVSAVWTVGFNDVQKQIVQQWMKDVRQSNRAIADAVGCEIEQVRTLKSLEQFKILRTKLAEGSLEHFTLEAVLELGALLHCGVPNTRFQAVTRILEAKGLIKQKNSEDGHNVELSINPELLEELRKKADDQV